MPGGVSRSTRIALEQFRGAVDLGHPVRSLIASPPNNRVHSLKFDPRVLKAHRGDPCHFVVSLRIESGFSITPPTPRNREAVPDRQLFQRPAKPEK